MKKNILAITLLCLLAPSLQAQFTTSGAITFERKVNLHRQMEDMDRENRWFQKMKSQIPKFTEAEFVLYFNPQESLYKPAKPIESPLKMFGGSPASENVVHTDFAKQKVAAEKQVFESKILIDDTMRVIEWKINDEVRTIANYKCRKAVGKMFDSVYIVAFYSEDIPVSGGPEMFSGLPGMILEIAIPRMYSTWIATNIVTRAPTKEELAPPTKGKKSTQQELAKSIHESMKNWGDAVERNIWWCLL